MTLQSKSPVWSTQKEELRSSARKDESPLYPVLSVSGEDRKNPNFPWAKSLPDYGQRLSNPAGVRMAEGNENVTLEKKCCFHILLGSHKEEASNIILLGGFRV